MKDQIIKNENGRRVRRHRRVRKEFKVCVLFAILVVTAVSCFTNWIHRNTIETTDEKYYTYTVATGDTLWDISIEFYDDPYDYYYIKKYNNLESLAVAPGTELKIPTEEEKKNINLLPFNIFD